jgi:hypothetical protein
MSISQDTTFVFSPKNLLVTLSLFATVVLAYADLKAQVTRAKELPEPIYDPSVREELIKMNLELSFIRNQLNELKGNVITIEERLYND